MQSRAVAQRLERLRRRPAAETLDDVAALPPPARRFLEHACGSRAPTASGVRLTMTGSVTQAGRRLALRADEVLVPSHGFVWRARARIGPLAITVSDHYFQRSSRVEVRLLGLVPIGGESGPDTAASSRGRLAAESIWVPSMLTPRPGVRWTAVDDDCAQVHLAIDGSEECLTLCVDSTGRLKALRMRRWGNVGVPAHAALPYGFACADEGEFGGYKIPTRLEGGWWFGTDRYRADEASRFVVTGAMFD